MKNIGQNKSHLPENSIVSSPVHLKKSLYDKEGLKFIYIGDYI